MKYQFSLVAQEITQINGPPVSVYPPDKPVPLGVGFSFTGRYATLLGSPDTAYFNYTRTNTSLGSLAGYNGVLGLGQLALHLSTQAGDEIVLFYSYQVLTTDPSVPFTTAALRGQVTAAQVNGHSTKAKLRLTTTDGGRSYQATLRLCCQA